MLQNRISSCIAAATIATVALRGALFAAEAPAAKPGSSQPPHGVKASDPAKKQSPEAAIRAALAKTVELGYKETPLRDVATDLQSKLGVPVRLDAKALDEIGIGIDSPVTFSSSRLSAKAAIALMLRKHGLKTVIKYESLLITTPEEADNFFLDTRVYDVSDLVRGNGGAAIQDGVCDSLIDVIKTSIGPTTWDDVGGVGTAMPFAAAGIDAIVVRQTAEVCEQVEALLSGLRAIRDARGAGQQPVGAGQTKAAIATMPKSSAGPVLFAPQPSDAEKTVREALRKPVNLQFKETPLCDVIEQLKKATNLPIALDKRMLDAVEVSLKTPITLEGSGRALRAILDELVRAHNLAWTYLDNERSLVVTIPEEERERLVTRSYDLSGMPSYRNERGDGVPDYDAIVEAVTRSIEPTTWVNAGGCGTIAVLEAHANHAIVVTQTWQGHLKIESLLAKLYHGRGVPTKDDIAKLPPGPTDGDGKYLPPTVLELDPKRDSLIRANNDFAFDLYKQASKGGREKGNLFFSPCGIATAMSLVYSGAPRADRGRDGQNSPLRHAQRGGTTRVSLAVGCVVRG